jgi:hypothetical protein
LKLKPDAQGVNRSITLDSLHKYYCMDAPSKEELVRYAMQWKERYKKLQRELRQCKDGN